MFSFCRYLNRGADKVLQECEAKLAELQNLTATKDGEKKDLESKIQRFQKQLANSRVRKLELENSLEIMRISEEVEQREREIRKQKEKLRSMGLERYEE